MAQAETSGAQEKEEEVTKRIKSQFANTDRWNRQAFLEVLEAPLVGPAASRVDWAPQLVVG